MEDSVWHKVSAKDKPSPYEYILVETNTKHYPYRIVIVDDVSGWWRDAYKTSYFFPRWCDKKQFRGNDFTVKRWAYLKDIK